jgi:pyruvate formate lyase activating enzyme
VLYYETQPEISQQEIYNFLDTRAGKLDGVVLSGGEPTLYPKIAKFAEKIKAMGFLFKLDTNGSFPDRVIKMHKDGLIDMLGIDYKAPATIYNDIAGANIDKLAQKVQKLIRYAVDNNIPYDIRTTVHKKLLSEAHLIKMRSELDSLGVKNWTLQQFHKTEIIDESLLEEDTYSNIALTNITKKLGDNTYLRGI